MIDAQKAPSSPQAQGADDGQGASPPPERRPFCARSTSRAGTGSAVTALITRFVGQQTRTLAENRSAARAPAAVLAAGVAGAATGGGLRVRFGMGGRGHGVATGFHSVDNVS